LPGDKPVRLTLAIVVTVLQVAGPWLCCCGPLRAFVAPVAVPSIASAASDEPGEGTCPHCRRDRAKDHAVADANPTPAQKPTKPIAPGRCPCCEIKLLDAVAAQPNRDVDQLTAIAALLPVLLTLNPVADILPAGPTEPLAGTSDLPFLTTEVRLHAHHALRC
jgi:hypothetical protein